MGIVFRLDGRRRSLAVMETPLLKTRRRKAARQLRVVAGAPFSKLRKPELRLPPTLFARPRNRPTDSGGFKEIRVSGVFFMATPVCISGDEVPRSLERDCDDPMRKRRQECSRWRREPRGGPSPPHLFPFCDECFADPQTGEAPGVTRSRNVRSRCRCSMCPAIHINSRSWLRSSSTHEPSDPPPRVVICTPMM